MTSTPKIRGDKLVLRVGPTNPDSGVRQSRCDADLDRVGSHRRHRGDPSGTWRPQSTG
jgi:hypothetical protein